MTLAVEVAGPGDPGDLVAVAVPVVKGADGPELVAGTPSQVGGVALPTALDAPWCARQAFSGRKGQVLVLRPAVGAPLVILAGVGPGTPGAEQWRQAGAAVVRAAGQGGTAAFALPAGAGAETAAAVAEGAVMAAYRVAGRRSSPPPGPVDRLRLVVEGDAQAVSAGAGRGAAVAGAVVAARQLINTPPSDLTPEVMADRVSELLAGAPGVTVEVWDEARIADERLGGVLGVSRGSHRPPRFVRADYHPAEPAAVDGRVPHLVLVGKGITFDSGGLSLKTADGMTPMKTDMTGAACVLLALGACAATGVRIRVTALAPMAENMPGGSAMKPGDVLTIRNGATIEVLNTDAEGRLILADALSLAVELAPDAIIDVATLTGSATAAFGPAMSPVFSNRAALRDRLRDAGERCGEQFWPMPMPEEYREHLDSDLADMRNIGRPGQAGASVAALLLSRFVGDVPWAHLDIAGTGRAAEASGYLSRGGTAFSLRTLVEVARSYENG